MPSIGLYQSLHGGMTVGAMRKKNSDMIMDYTFSGDIGYRIAYLYDWYHDVASYERNRLRNLHPEDDVNKIPIEIKFLPYSSQTYSKDIVTMHIELRPQQKCNVPYYEKMFGKYDAIFPVGLFIDIMDEAGQYNKWLVVATANYYGIQFPTYEVLPCDKVFQWVFNGEKINMAGVLRSQNSYLICAS